MPELKAWDKLERRADDDRRLLQRSFGGQDRRSGIDRREHPESWKVYWAAKEEIKINY